jgi:hypothetical protein
MAARMTVIPTLASTVFSSPLVEMYVIFGILNYLQG